jgi:hypothetical protein
MKRIDKVEYTMINLKLKFICFFNFLQEKILFQKRNYISVTPNYSIDKVKGKCLYYT